LVAIFQPPRRQNARKILITIIIPAYNCERTIAEAIRSCAGQTFADIEVIVVDDGSLDSTAEHLLKISEGDTRIRVIRIQHAGVTEAFNIGMHAAKGKYIARMDADDVMHPEKIMKQVQFLDSHPEVGVVSCLVNYGGNRLTQEGYARHVDWINTLITPETIALNRFVDSPVCNPSVMFRRELVEQFGGARSGDFPEDYDMWLRWLDAGVKFAKVPEVLFTWNDLPSRLTRNDPRYSADAFERAKTEYLAKFILQNNPENRPVYLCGTGRVTRRKSDFLINSGVNIGGYLEIDAAKAGTSYDGIPVVAFDNRPDRDHAYIVNYVSVRGAREELRTQFSSEGRREANDFIMAG